MSRVEDVLEQIISDGEFPSEQIDAWIRDKEFEEIERFAQLSAQIYDWSWPYSQIYNIWFDNLPKRLRSEYVPIVLALLKYLPEEVDDYHDYLALRVAAKLASAGAVDVIEGVFKTLPYSNLWAYLMQELIITDFSPSHEYLLQIAEAVQQHNHPLSVLPLSLLSSEIGIPYHHPPGTSRRVEPDQQRKLSQLSPESGIIFKETTKPDLQERLKTAFARWVYKSHGRIEAKQFTAQQPISAETITQTRLLLELNLDCLKGVVDVGIWPLSHYRVMSTLFSAASSASGHHGWLGYPYGRRATWVSVGALLNEPEGTPITTLNDMMEHIQWFQIEMRSPWFYRMMWNEAIIALSKDGHVLTVLAATDTD